MKTHFRLGRVTVMAWASLILIFPIKGTHSASGLAVSPADAPPTKETTKPVEKLSPAPTESQKSALDKALSWQAREVVKLHQSGADPSVIMAYVDNLTLATPPSADEIIALRNHGLSPDIISAYIKRAHQLQAQAPAPAPAAPQSNMTGPVVPSTPMINLQPVPIYIYSQPQPNPIVYSTYTSPSYIYVNPPKYHYAPYYTYPGLSSSYQNWSSWASPRFGYSWYFGKHAAPLFSRSAYDRNYHRPYSHISYAGSFRKGSAWTPYQGGTIHRGHSHGYRGHGGWKR